MPVGASDVRMSGKLLCVQAWTIDHCSPHLVETSNLTQFVCVWCDGACVVWCGGVCGVVWRCVCGVAVCMCGVCLVV